MSSVFNLASDIIGGVVEAVGDVVESVVDVVEDVGRSINDYVIQPILDDPLTAIATMAGATFLGPMIAPTLGTGLGAATGYIATGLGAAAGNTVAGLAQGEDFDEAVKGGLVTGVAAGATSAGFDYLTDAGAFAPEGAAPEPAVAESFPIDLPPNIVGTELPPLSSVADGALTGGASGTSSAAASVIPEVDWLTEGVKFPKTDGIAAREIQLDTPLKYYLDDSVNYNLMAGIPETSPIGFKPDGSVGLNVQVDALPSFKYSMDSLDPYIVQPNNRIIESGMGDTWVNDSQIYGVETPRGTITETGFKPLEPRLATMDLSTTANGTAGAGKTLGEKLKNFEFNDISLTDVGKAAMNYAVENPLTTLAAATLATGVLGGAGGPPAGTSGPPSGGRARDENFTRPLDYYNYLRDLEAYSGDLTRYGERPGEHRFFVNTRFEPVPIPAVPPVGSASAKSTNSSGVIGAPEPRHSDWSTGGLMQYKQHLAAGGIAGPQTPQNAMSQREAIMAALQQRAAMAKRQDALAQMQGGMPMEAPGRAPQGMSGMMTQQPPARQGPINRNPKTAYYQYGTPPMAAGGALSMVRSMNIRGGADGRSDDVDALLSDGEYVIDAETVALLGNGSSEAGARRLDKMRSAVRQHKGKNLSKGKISPNAKSPLAYIKIKGA